jgi:hypothetical protein
MIGYFFAVMPALVAGHPRLFQSFSKQDVDGRDRPGHGRRGKTRKQRATGLAWREKA